MRALTSTVPAATASESLDMTTAEQQTDPVVGRDTGVELVNTDAPLPTPRQHDQDNGRLLRSPGPQAPCSALGYKDE